MSLFALVTKFMESNFFVFTRSCQGRAGASFSWFENEKKNPTNKKKCFTRNLKLIHSKEKKLKSVHEFLEIHNCHCLIASVECGAVVCFHQINFFYDSANFTVWKLGELLKLRFLCFVLNIYARLLRNWCQKGRKFWDLKIFYEHRFKNYTMFSQKEGVNLIGINLFDLKRLYFMFDTVIMIHILI